MSQPKVFSKELCDWSKDDFARHFDKLQEIVAEPQYVCTKCGRAASKKKWLCKAKKLQIVQQPLEV